MRAAVFSMLILAVVMQFASDAREPATAIAALSTGEFVEKTGQRVAYRLVLARQELIYVQAIHTAKSDAVQGLLARIARLERQRAALLRLEVPILKR